MPPKRVTISLEKKYNGLMDIIEKRSTAIEIALELHVAKNTVYDWIRENDIYF